jgi:hypothetical protein
MVIEVSKTHESYNDLFEDAHIIHFSAETSVQAWVGVKLYAGHGGRLRCMFQLRDTINNGILAGSDASTDFRSMQEPKNPPRIFWIECNSCYQHPARGFVKTATFFNSRVRGQATGIPGDRGGSNCCYGGQVFS